MPKYTFLCKECGMHQQKYTLRIVQQIQCDSCPKDTWMQRKMPVISGKPDVTEVVNKYTGQTAKQDQQQALKARHDKHYWNIEVPRMVSSGVYEIETMLEQGWIWFDDHKQMQVHTKPPFER